MGKQLRKTKKTTRKKAGAISPTNMLSSLHTQFQSAVRMMVRNGDLLRRELINRLLNPSQDINSECGYPDTLDKDDYRSLYDREGVARRVVDVMPEECWEQVPQIYETEDQNETEFEKVWKEVETKHHCFAYLERVDKLSGIGQFGILLLGLSDGKNLWEAVEGVDLVTGEVSSPLSLELLYLKPFDEASVQVDTTETNVNSPRYGCPVLYTVEMKVSTGSGSDSTTKSVKVHWTRVIHVADNREVSEVFGIPRQQPVYNRLHDIRKIMGGSGEMFWKGGFPGYAFETDPDVDASSLDTDDLKEELQDYFNSLQRYMRLTGVKAHSLTPQVADPASHVETNLKCIGASLAIPYRVFIGSEKAELASSQDMKTWNRRMSRRQEQYLTPFLVRPFIDRLIMYGILPQPNEYFVEWPDRESPSDKEIADIARVLTEAMAKYVAGGVEEIMPRTMFYVMVLGMTQEEAEAVDAEVVKYLEEKEEERDEEEEQRLIEEEKRMLEEERKERQEENV